MTQREDFDERVLLDAIFRPSPERLQEPDIFQHLRKLARECGFDVQRNGSGYSLFEGGKMIAGDRHPLDTKDLARELQHRHILGWE